MIADPAIHPPADWLALLLDSTGEGVYVIDTEGRCIFVNRAARDMLGWPASEIIGRNMHDLIHHSTLSGHTYPVCDCPIFDAFRRGTPCRVDDEVLWRADGTSFPAEYSSYPIFQNGEARGAVVTMNDITERKQSEESLRSAHALLERRVDERTRELRELANHLESVQETERKRIAREIHDELGSLLTAFKMDLNWIKRRAGDPLLQSALVDKCVSMGKSVDTAIDALGRIMTDLRPSILDHQGLWAALEWQANEWQHGVSDEIAAEFKMFVTKDVPSPEGGLAIAIFRIFQEILSNISRHSCATRASIRIDVDAPPDPVLYMQVSDNGIGARREALTDPRSYGVLGMRERAAFFGGSVRIESSENHGTTVRLVMPLKTLKTGGAS
ncbi:sensor histidine kinase [Pandoraea anhela]|uniref:Histidine kinase n=1 Tax=Pandoraea anhela TaxID=2508295 RepID=A0A5E4WE36_9BURK|nr:PAS domain-containing sensor histidine kinase [Pandoraea anhela]VVE23367.1 histidine kinase [Pandoraea anhela]